DFSESGLQGYASVQSSWSGVSVGVKGTTDLRNYDSRAVNFHQLFGTASYLDSLHTFMLRLGVQAGHSSNNATHAAFLFNPKYSLTLTPSLRLHAELFSGLENASFAEFLRINPYVSDSSVVSFARTSIKGVVGVTYQPSVSLTTRFDLSYSSAGNTPVLIADSGFAFNPIYIEAQLVMMNLDLRYLLSDNDALSTTLRYTSATSGGAHVPYIAPIVWSFRYDRTVLRSLTLSLLSDYVSARRTQFAVTDEVQSYFNLSIRGEYSLSPSFSAYLRFDNLLNSSIFVWQGYRERGAFAAGGVRWMFN
ncbi:MAG: hypothetical protein JNL32_12205, partial [Candidatus Kapabacteria bacterium]|nr:hypothetical protein [Candidatus Kapabacteria bacterium]